MCTCACVCVCVCTRHVWECEGVCGCECHTPRCVGVHSGPRAHAREAFGWYVQHPGAHVCHPCAGVCPRRAGRAGACPVLPTRWQACGPPSLRGPPTHCASFSGLSSHMEHTEKLWAGKAWTPPPTHSCGAEAGESGAVRGHQERPYSAPTAARSPRRAGSRAATAPPGFPWGCRWCPGPTLSLPQGSFSLGVRPAGTGGCGSGQEACRAGDPTLPASWAGLR